MCPSPAGCDYTPSEYSTADQEKLISTDGGQVCGVQSFEGAVKITAELSNQLRFFLELGSPIKGSQPLVWIVFSQSGDIRYNSRMDSISWNCLVFVLFSFGSDKDLTQVASDSPAES